MDYYSAIKHDGFPPFALTWIEVEGIMLSEVVGEWQLSYGYIYMGNI